MKKCTIFANEVLLYAWIACHVLFFLSAGFVWWLYEPGIWTMLIPICSIVINCFETDRWCLMLTSTGMACCTNRCSERGCGYNIPIIQGYSTPTICTATCSAAYKVNFFVFTNRRLSNEELTQINQVAPSSDLIKIRYTRKTYKKLLEALPPSIALEVKQIHDVYIKK